MKKKIAVFTNKLAGGGTERVVSILLQALCNDFDLYLVLTSNEIEYPVPENVPVVVIGNGSETESYISRFATLPLLAWKYYKFCKKNQIDISMSFLNRPNYIACMLKYFRWKKRILISERSSTFMQYNYHKNVKSYIGKFLVKHLYPKADLILPNSNANITDLKKYFKVNTSFLTIYNPINLKNILSRKEEVVEEIDFSKFTYLMIGRFVEEKDYTTLLEAFAILPDKKDCQLLLIGDGPDKAKIKIRAAELEISTSVIFINFVENPFKYLSKSDCLVFSSLQEGFPNVVIEALACSLPVISTDCKTGPRELLAPGTDYNYQLRDEIEMAEYGILVPVKKFVLLSEAMQLLYNNASLYAGYKHKALNRAAGFDLPEIIKKYKQILDEN